MATVTSPELEEIVLPVIEPDEDYEVVDGRIVEEPPLGMYEIRMANRLARSITLFDPTEQLGEVVIEALFILNDAPMLRRRPDVAFASRERWPADSPADRETAWDVIPDLAVEITSPTDLIDDLMDKIEEYFAAGVRLVWVIYPKQRKLYAYQSPTSLRILGAGDELDGGSVLPGFRLPLTPLFELRGGGPTTIA
jgi:Uma2 family endonuclease